MDVRDEKSAVSVQSGSTDELGHPVLSRRNYLLGSVAVGVHLVAPLSNAIAAPRVTGNTVKLDGSAGGKRFDGIGVVNGGGATSVLLKDYPEPQRSQILDFVYKPKFGASVSALLVEIPGDGNSTQGSMPSHMHTRDDLDYNRGYTWWILKEAKRRNPKLSLDATAWSAPGWIGDKKNDGANQAQRDNADFWSQDAVEYHIKWLEGLRSVHGLELDAIGCRNEKGASASFAKALKKALLSRNFKNVKLHAFDNWGENKLDFVSEMLRDKELRDAIDVISAHTFTEIPASPAVLSAAKQMDKPIWNTEDHVYRKGFDCAISIVNCFNRNYHESGATKVITWYDIGGLYPVESYSEDPPAVLAWEPWSGHYKVREALWGYAHYGQFSEIGWIYLNGGSGRLDKGGTYVTLKSSDGDYSVIWKHVTPRSTRPSSWRLRAAFRPSPCVCGEATLPNSSFASPTWSCTTKSLRLHSNQTPSIHCRQREASRKVGSMAFPNRGRSPFRMSKISTRTMIRSRAATYRAIRPTSWVLSRSRIDPTRSRANVCGRSCQRRPFPGRPSGSPIPLSAIAPGQITRSAPTFG
jgi:O-glycosyl hydrolase